MSLDTTAEAAHAQIRAYRRMGSARTVSIAAEMSESIRKSSFERLRRERPELSERAARLALASELYGLDLSDR
jgi:hypothetical protein